MSELIFEAVSLASRMLAFRLKNIGTNWGDVLEKKLRELAGVFPDVAEMLENHLAPESGDTHDVPQTHAISEAADGLIERQRAIWRSHAGSRLAELASKPLRHLVQFYGFVVSEDECVTEPDEDGHGIVRTRTTQFQRNALPVSVYIDQDAKQEDVVAMLKKIAKVVSESAKWPPDGKLHHKPPLIPQDPDPKELLLAAAAAVDEARHAFYDEPF